MDRRGLERRRLRALGVVLLCGFGLLGAGVDHAFREPGPGGLLIGLGTAVLVVAVTILLNEPPDPRALRSDPYAGWGPAGLIPGPDENG